MNATIFPRLLTAFAVILLYTVSARAGTAILPPGTHVQFDKVYASNPGLSQWIEGEITGYMAAQNYYKIRSTDGINYTIANDSRWIRVAAAKDKAVTPQQNAPSKQAPAPTGKSQPAGGYTPGAHVQFDRVEALNPARGRWDSGTIIERVANNRYKIRGDNGTTYTIQDDPRWILPAGATPQGPRHDYLDKPQPAAGNNTSNANNPPAPANAGAMPPDGLYNVTNLGALHSVGELEIRGATYRGLEASGPFKQLGGTGNALVFSGGLAGLEDVRITGANYMGLSKIGQPVIKIRYVSASGFNEELEATKEK